MFDVSAQCTNVHYIIKLYIHISFVYTQIKEYNIYYSDVIRLEWIVCTLYGLYIYILYKGLKTWKKGMCILLCFTEYNEKSRLGTTYPDELFKNAVAAIYKAASVATKPLFFLFFTLLLLLIFFFFVLLLCICTWISLSCREHVWWREFFFPSHKEVGTLRVGTIVNIILQQCKRAVVKKLSFAG